MTASGPIFHRFVEKGNLEVLLFTLQSRMRAANQKPYTPKEGKMIHDINRAWERLEKAEHERELALREELIRQEKLEQLAARYGARPPRPGAAAQQGSHGNADSLQVQPQGANARDVAVGEPAPGEPGQLRLRPGGGGGGRQEARGHRDRHLRVRGARAGRRGRVLGAAGGEVRPALALPSRRPRRH